MIVPAIVLQVARAAAPALLALALGFAGCKAGAPRAAVPPIDVRPIGDGLTFLGVALVLATLIAIVAGLFRPRR